MATPEPEQELNSISRDEEPDTRAEERGELTFLEQPINELLTARGLQHLAPALDTLGVGRAADLSCIYVEDLMEEGVEDSDARRLLHGFETFGAIRSFHPSSPEQMALPLKLYGRFGAVGPRPGRKRRAQPPPPHDYRWDAPAQTTTLEWRQPRPFHDEVFSQREPMTAGHPVWVDGIRAPHLPPPFGHGEASSSSAGQGPALPATQILSPQDRQEYLKACEHDQELEDEVLACVLATEPPESRGIVKGAQVWVKFPNGELLALEINHSD